MQSNLRTPEVLVREFSFVLLHRQGSDISPRCVLALAQGSGNHLHISSQTVLGTRDLIYLDLNFSPPPKKIPLTAPPPGTPQARSGAAAG